MPSGRNLLAAVEAVRAAGIWNGTRLHGEEHWRRVATHGLDLALATPGADPLVAVLFGLFHDSQRVNDGHDPDHGVRGARLAARLNDAFLGLDADRLALLTAACADHTRGGTSPVPAIGACWDADRLDLVRLGYGIDSRKLSTPAARMPESIERARRMLARTPRWDEVFARLDAATGGAPAGDSDSAAGTGDSPAAR